MAWYAQGARGVLYTPGSFSTPDAGAIWASVIAQTEPEMLQKMRNQPVPQSLAAGRAGDLALRITVQPSRVDFFVSPADGDPLAERPDASTSDAAPLVDECSRLMTAALDHFPTTRVALVLDVIEPVADENEALTKFRAALPFIKIPPGTAEINFQLNPAQPFASNPEHTMFRLCRWATARLQAISLQIGPGAELLSQGVSHFEQRHAILYQMDTSSAPSPENLSPGVARVLVSELSAEVRALLAEGFDRFEK